MCRGVTYFMLTILDKIVMILLRMEILKYIDFHFNNPIKCMYISDSTFHNTEVILYYSQQNLIHS